MSHATRHLPLACLITISLIFVGFALAHESDDPTHMQAHAEAEASVSTDTKPIRPLDLIRKAKEAKQNIQNNAGINAGMHFDAKMQMRTASSVPEKRPLKERMASSSDLRAKIKGAIRMHGGLIKERFSLAVRQFEKIVARIESRIEKMKGEGIATASVEAELEVAKTAQAEAKADVQAVADFVAGADENADRAQVRTQLQTLIKEAQTSIRTAHQALQKVIKSLVTLAKENKPKVETEASVEAETSASVESSE